MDRDLFDAILRLEELSRVRADRCVVVSQIHTWANDLKLVGFYVEQHNTVVPHFAFEGQTPDEIYFGTGASVPAKLKEKRAEARAARLAHNRAVTCARCKVEDTKPAMVTIGSNTS